jgi:hypothetical protein
MSLLPRRPPFAPQDYVAAGVMMAPTYLKWAVIFEDPNQRAVWIGKALPREWLAVGASDVAVDRAPTRYGRVSYRLHAEAGAGSDGDLRQAPASPVGYSVHANVTLPRTWSNPSLAPPGGVRLRLRAPAEHAGKLVHVTVGGKPWTSIDAAAETVDFTVADLTPDVLTGLAHVVASWN